MAKDKASKKSKKALLEPVNRGMLNDAVDTILNGMDNLFSRFQDELNDFREEVNTNFDKVKVRLRGVEDEVKGLKSELSNTPTRKEFNKLKEKVDRYHPSN